MSCFMECCSMKCVVCIMTLIREDLWASWKDDSRYLHKPTGEKAGGCCIYTGGLLPADSHIVPVLMHGTRHGCIPRSGRQAAHGDALPPHCLKTTRQLQPATQVVSVYVKSTLSSYYFSKTKYTVYMSRRASTFSCSERIHRRGAKYAKITKDIISIHEEQGA